MKRPAASSSPRGGEYRKRAATAKGLGRHPHGPVMETDLKPIYEFFAKHKK